MISFVITPILNRFQIVAYDPAYAAYETLYELKTQILCIIALFFLYIGYYEGMISKGLMHFLPSFRSGLNIHKTKVLILIIFLLSIFSYIFLINNFDIKVQNFWEYFIYTNVSRFGRGDLAFFCYAYIFAFFISMLAIFQKNVRHKKFFLFIIILSLLLALLTRSRGHVILLLFIILIFYNYKVKKLNWVNLASMFLSFLIIVFLIAQFRGTKDFRITKENLYITFGGLFTEFQATSALLSQYEKESLEHYHGRILFEDIFFTLIPRRVWSTKPELYGGIVVTNIIVPNRQHGSYYSVGTFSSSFADFGYGGVFLAMFLMGLFMRVIYDYMVTQRDNNFVLLIYAIFCFHLWAFMRGGFGAAPELIKTLLSMVVIYLFISKRKEKEINSYKSASSKSTSSF